MLISYDVTMTTPFCAESLQKGPQEEDTIRAKADVNEKQTTPIFVSESSQFDRRHDPPLTLASPAVFPFRADCLPNHQHIAHIHMPLFHTNLPPFLSRSLLVGRNTNTLWQRASDNILSYMLKFTIEARIDEEPRLSSNVVLDVKTRSLSSLRRKKARMWRQR